MEIKELNVLLKDHVMALAEEATFLFEVDLDKDLMYQTYLDSFPDGTNEMFRERREYDCSSCRQFIKLMGNKVFIRENQLTTIWDFETAEQKFQPVLNALSQFVRSHHVSDVAISKFSKMGTPVNHEEVQNGKVLEWNHLFVELPSKFVDKSSKSEADIKGKFRDIRNVFKRSLDEITEESVLTVLELIAQNSLYKGEEWKGALNEFLKFKKQYESLSTPLEKELYAWEKGVKVGGGIGKIRNHSIGTLLINLSKDMDLDTAVRKYEVIVAPSNYKRPKALFTKKMLEEAKATIDDLGLTASLGRTHMTPDDITVNNILFSNKDVAKRIEGGDVFAEMMNELPVNPKKFSKVEEISIENFIKNVLPFQSEVEFYLENRHQPNLMSVLGPKDKKSESMFKWDNSASWAYAGNMTDSSMRENVKAAGGSVDGVLRFSIQWNDNEYDGNDLDAHCYEPNGFEIYFRNKGNLSPTGGVLDVDIVNPRQGIPAVENITWATKVGMEKGVYKFFVHNYSHNGGRHGFKAEVEFDGQIHSFEYNQNVKQGENVQVAEITFDGTNFSIKELLPSTVSSKEVWNLKTNQFVPVSVAMFSPNYWDEQQGIGHKHYFFILKDCLNPENPNGFYNEFLREDLVKHKRVFEALGGKMAVEYRDEQLSGVGFSSTKRNDFIVKVKGQSERLLKVKI